SSSLKNKLLLQGRRGWREQFHLSPTATARISGIGSRGTGRRSTTSYKAPGGKTVELAISTMWETSAVVELLERKGILTKQDMLAMIQELRRREPRAITPPRLDT
ncbi:hypothetical protein MYX04_14455, partial [Nitrospiraceae bacterium AH_259_D15_M11_P09]|nr:hypothetical protein [Nitrospiraceae bacterium AH_259_D15_M11_P09]